MPQNIQRCFQRYEKKYLLNLEQYQKIRAGLAPYMEADEHGRYTICNLYYDTPDFQLIRASLDKPVYKEKLRMRSYGVPADGDSVFVELKKKYKGVVYKRRTALEAGRRWITWRDAAVPVRKIKSAGRSTGFWAATIPSRRCSSPMIGRHWRAWKTGCCG
ncbi:MAG: VTC domain-containing protein [Intestinimonas sp.]